MKPTVDDPDDDMLPEYDFDTSATRGKYSAEYRRGHSVRVLKADGSESIQYFAPIDGTVALDPDVRRIFPDSESVNTALRTLMTARSRKS